MDKLEADICLAKYSANQIAMNLSGAYWSTASRQYLLDSAKAELVNLANTLGFDLIERTSHTVETLTDKAA